MSFFFDIILLGERWSGGGGREGKRWSEEKGSKKTLGR